jgi:Protein of unknown function (DUF4038)/Putative collagen-binding domain of a collagenase
VGKNFPLKVSTRQYLEGGCIAAALALALCSPTKSESADPDAGVSKPLDGATELAEGGAPDSGPGAPWHDAGSEAVTVLDASPSAADASAQGTVYPLKVGPTGRYLVDQNGRPFLMVGDAPQSLVVNLSEADAELYFADRQAHGFNTVWINLLCAAYTGGRVDGTTYDGIGPFTTPGDLSTPNEAYFARADDMIRLAAKYGLVVLLDPAETGSWLTTLSSNGVTKDRAYGQYLGDRYKGFDNLIWMSGNDFQSWRMAADDSVVLAVALGIRDVDSRHIHTVELDFNTSSSTDDPTWLPIISLDAAYTYYPTYAQVLKSYNRPGALPVFLVEGVYEFESNQQSHQATTATLRRQEYWTQLSGGMGQIYGNHYVWTFEPPWKDMLDSPGAVEMPHLRDLLAPRAWYSLVPDQAHSVVTAGFGTMTVQGAVVNVDDSDYATTGRTADGSLVMVYLPTSRTITVDMTKLRQSARAQFYDPSNGTFSPVAGSPLPNTGTRTFAPPGPNGDGDGDWVLVLEAP